MKQVFSVLLSIFLAWAALSGTAACSIPAQIPEGHSGAAAEQPDSAGKENAGDNAAQKDDRPEKRIWLTFDDGPTDSTTPKILDILEAENVKATFFVIGRQIAGREKILQREADGGHAIGIHTYTHEYKKIYASAGALLKDIALCREAIRSVLPAFETDLYRFPGGSYNVNKDLIATVEHAGFRHYDWNASAEDAVDPSAPANALYQNVVTSAGEKRDVILLMHDGVGYKETIRCLPAVIDYFREREFAFCTL